MCLKVSLSLKKIFKSVETISSKEQIDSMQAQ